MSMFDKEEFVSPPGLRLPLRVVPPPGLSLPPGVAPPPGLSLPSEPGSDASPELWGFTHQLKSGGFPGAPGLTPPSHSPHGFTTEPASDTMSLEDEDSLLSLLDDEWDDEWASISTVTQDAKALSGDDSEESSDLCKVCDLAETKIPSTLSPDEETCKDIAPRIRHTLQLDELLPEDDKLTDCLLAVAGKTPLRAGAVAWQPRADDVSTPARELDLSTAKAVENVRLAFEASGTTASLEVVRCGHGWKIFAQKRADFDGPTNSILVIAKVALLRSAEESKRTYVIGYEARPFEVKDGGFSAQLAEMEDESVACWNFYAKGFCYRGCSCRWQHPKRVVTVEVLVDQ